MMNTISTPVDSRDPGRFQFGSASKSGGGAPIDGRQPDAYWVGSGAQGGGGAPVDGMLV